ncbi:aminotransferase class I/II-fold pyridoxal phosphate-dependent enzyme, partial [Thiomonas sp.]|uniref:aminotransferase class I/II-fold pyridoxal phosphate-dependent enzyme n=1 Tax=Thiomonas sp. TaxID=2047785 RepID=UPI0033904F82
MACASHCNCTYFGFLRVLLSLGLRVVEIPMLPRAGLSLEALELALDTQPVKAVLAVPTLSNPLGTIMPTASKKRLAELLERRKVPLIEDVICNDLAPTEDGRRLCAVDGAAHGHRHHRAVSPLHRAAHRHRPGRAVHQHPSLRQLPAAQRRRALDAGAR